MRPIEHERCRKALFDFMADGLAEHGNDMWRTLMWANTKLNTFSIGNVSDERFYLVRSRRELSVAEKNQVIHELTMESSMHGF